jgi:hypothetical protein
LRRLTSTIAFGFAITAVALGVVALAALSVPPATVASEEVEASASKSAPLRVPFPDRESETLTVRVEPATAADRARLQLDVSFNIEQPPDFGAKVSGQLRLSKSNGQEILVAPLENTDYKIKCNPDPRHMYRATELTFTLRPTAILSELAEGEPVYADIMILAEDGTQYDVGRLQSHVTY